MKLKSAFILFATIFTTALTSCNTKKVEIHEYHYQYLGFNESKKLELALEEVKALHAQFDYIVTKNEALIPWSRNEDVPKDTLHRLHQIIHRLEPFKEDKAYKEGEIVISIEVAHNDENTKALFHFKRYRVRSNGETEIEHDFGIHEVNISNFELVKRADFLAEKFAQVSFK